MSEDNSEHEINIIPIREQVTGATELGKRNTALIAMPSLDEVIAEGERYERNSYLNSILHDLPDHSISEETQQQAYSIKSASMKGVEKAAKLGAQQEVANYLRTHPEAKGLGCRFSGKAYIEKNSPISYTLAFTHMLDCILDRRAGFATQKAILDSVKKSTGIRELNANIWKLPLKKFMLGKLRDRIEAHNLHISLAACSNMSDIRMIIDTHYAKKLAVHKLRLDVTITPNEIIVNDTSYKIINRQSSTYTYKSIRLKIGDKRPWLRVNELKVLFGLPA